MSILCFCRFLDSIQQKVFLNYAFILRSPRMVIIQNMFDWLCPLLSFIFVRNLVLVTNVIRWYLDRPCSLAGIWCIYLSLNNLINKCGIWHQERVLGLRIRQTQTRCHAVTVRSLFECHQVWCVNSTRSLWKDIFFFSQNELTLRVHISCINLEWTWMCPKWKKKEWKEVGQHWEHL